MPNPLDALDSLVIETPAQAAAEPVSVQADTPTPSAGEDLTYDPADNMNQRFDAFFNQTDPEPVPIDGSVDTSKLEAGDDLPADEPPSSDPDSLETPDLTAAKAKMSMKAAEAFNKVKANAEVKIKELRTKLQELESKSPSADVDAKIQEIEAKLQERETKLAYYEVREHPEYKEAVEAPTMAVRNELHKIAVRNEMELKELVAAMLEADPAKQSNAMSELALNLNERDKAKFWQLADDWEVIQSKEQYIRENATNAWQHLQEKQKNLDAQKKEASTSEWKQASDKVWSRLAEKVPALKEMEPDKLRSEYGGVDFESMPVNDRAYAVAAAVTLVPMAKKLNAAAAEIKQLKATLAKYQRATPGAGAGNSTPMAPIDNSPGGFLDSIERRFQTMR